MTPEEIHQLAVEIYEALNWEGAELKDTAVFIIENLIEEHFQSIRCDMPGCYNQAYVEGWRNAGTMIHRMRVCKEHMHLLIGKEITE